VADANAELARQAAEKFGIPRVHPDADALISDPEGRSRPRLRPEQRPFDINARPLRRQRSPVGEAAGPRLPESGSLLALAEKHGTQTAIDFCYRYYSVVQEAAARARRGDSATPGLRRALPSGLALLSRRTTPGGSTRRWPARQRRRRPRQPLVRPRPVHHRREDRRVMAELHTCLPKRRKPKGAALSFGAGGAGATEEVAIALDDYAASSSSSPTAPGEISRPARRRPAARSTSSSRSSAPRNPTLEPCPPQRPLDRASRKGQRGLLRILAAASRGDAQYAGLPRAPMGYHDAVFNLFRDYYEALAAKREGKPYAATFPISDRARDDCASLTPPSESEPDRPLGQGRGLGPVTARN